MDNIDIKLYEQFHSFEINSYNELPVLMTRQD